MRYIYAQEAPRCPRHIYELDENGMWEHKNPLCRNKLIEPFCPRIDDGHSKICKKCDRIRKSSACMAVWWHWWDGFLVRLFGEGW
jgi:hypothetical protein